jgi:hypothetical protein
MSDFPVEGDKLRKLIKKSRQVPIPFGFNPGTSEEDDEFLAAHQRKAPEILGKLALAEGAGTKSAFGTFAVDGSEVHLICFRTIAQLAKKFKKYLKKYKITLNCVVMDPDGNVIDSDVETLDDWFREEDDRDDPAAEAAEAAAEAEPPDNAGIDAKDLAGRLRALQPKVAAAPAEVAERVAAGYAGAIRLVKSGQLEAASIAMAQLEAIMARLAAMPKTSPAPAAAAKGGQSSPVKAAADPRMDRLREAAETLAGRIETRLGGGPLMDDLARVAAMIDAGQGKAALRAMQQVQEGLRAAQGARDKWDRVTAALAPLVAGALASRNGPEAADLRRRWQAVQDQAEAGEWQAALDGLPGIIALLRAQAAA